MQVDISVSKNGRYTYSQVTHMNILRPADEIKVGKGKDGATVALLLLKIICCQQSEVDVATFSESLVSGM